MFNRFLHLPRQGFVYVPEGDDGPMSKAAAGQTIRNPTRWPPWIVVDHALSSIVVARWPGKLWAVEVIDPIGDRDLRAANQPRLHDDAGYTRAVAVNILRAVPVSSLFGARGEKVCAVINAATNLSHEQAMALAAARPLAAGEAQTRVWRCWLGQQGPPCHRGNFDRTLAIASTRGRSPVGSGLCVVSGEVGRRAEAIEGSSVWTTDPLDPEGAVLTEPWSRAGAALLDAALAFGAPDLTSDADFLILATAWRQIIGLDPV